MGGGGAGVGGAAVAAAVAVAAAAVAVAGSAAAMAAEGAYAGYAYGRTVLGESHAGCAYEQPAHWMPRAAAAWAKFAARHSCTP